MNLLNISSGIKTTYKVTLKYSLLWECALGIAASTYDELHHSLEKPQQYWSDAINKLSSEGKKELECSKKHNTWKTLLQLLHTRDFENLNMFLQYIKDLSEEDLRFYSLPFLGNQNEENRKDASSGDIKARMSLIELCSKHKFFPDYIEFICNVSINILKNHLITLMQAWYEVIIKPDETHFLSMLKKDFKTKSAMMEKLTAEKLVEWTIGTTYLPEPTITDVLLIPQYIYRPWTVEADDINTKIFYYPISDESLTDDKDTYAPAFTLVQGYKALGDEVRLKIIKFLYEGDKTLQELTEKLDMAKSTVHHHLSLLRSVRIVRTVNSMYQLNKDALFSIESDLKIYLEK
ncbi:ArsR/SmtB family transcription factor [Desnuesiella massiliensis]|uniref:ArsR/SmtB family transcription factor n=1 Tax=Desnuesiella massiliensis TaxID=1650662 RepID=UPI0006E3CBCA|nr:metalloregulator ArsR/SmtB family transcription factor [Desnuesiella massiliensis]